mgnify:CR=1 FL=1
MALAVGTQAPDFKLYNTDKKEVSLSDFKGKGTTRFSHIQDELGFQVLGVVAHRGLRGGLAFGLHETAGSEESDGEEGGEAQEGIAGLTDEEGMARLEAFAALVLEENQRQNLIAKATEPHLWQRQLLRLHPL